MRVLFDITHPADVHLFKNIVFELKKHGHQVKVVARNKEVAYKLLEGYNISFEKRPGYAGLVNKFLGMFRIDYLLYKISRSFRPDILISGDGNMYPAHVGWVTNKFSLTFDDVENEFFQKALTFPFVSNILTPACYEKELGKKQIRYTGFKELTYLHPNVFTPNKKILKILGVLENEIYTIVRFVAWDSTTDVGKQRGISYENKLKAISEFSKFGKVFITSESPLPEELKKYELKIPYGTMHDAIAFSSLLYGESSAMASEASMLGVPGIFINSKKRGFTNYLEKEYQSVFNFNEDDAGQISSIIKGVEILSNPDSQKIWASIREKILRENIDSTAFFTWFIENYPESRRIMKDNPEYQNKFKNCHK